MDNKLKHAFMNIFSLDETTPVYHSNNIKQKSETDSRYDLKKINLKGIQTNTLSQFIAKYGANAMFINNPKAIIKITENFAIGYEIIDNNDKIKHITLNIKLFVIPEEKVYIPVSEFKTIIQLKCIDHKNNNGIQILHENKEVYLQVINQNKEFSESLKMQLESVIRIYLKEFFNLSTASFNQKQVKILLSMMTLINYLIDKAPLTKYSDNLFSNNNVTVRDSIKPVFIKENDPVAIKLNPQTVLQNIELKLPKTL